jgi:UDP-glucose 4-epimerase
MRMRIVVRQAAVDSMKGKRVVVTGGAGFIGSNLAWALCDDNDVVVVDNLSTGRISNIKPLVDEKKVRFIQGCVTDSRLMKKTLKGADYVFHEAAVPSVPRSVRDPLATNEAGITGTLTTLIAARDCDIRKLIFASSSSVYGDAPTLPKSEEMPLNPKSPYALTKVACEGYCGLFDELYDLRTVCLRYFNVFGPRQDPTSEYAAVIPQFISKAFAGEDLSVYGDGRQTRDFTFVADAVRANLLAAESKAKGNYNIATGSRIQIRTLASKVIGATRSKARVKYRSPRSGDIRHSLADIAKARKDLGYTPEYTVLQGLKETIAWFSRESQ